MRRQRSVCGTVTNLESYAGWHGYNDPDTDLSTKIRNYRKRVSQGFFLTG